MKKIIATGLNGNVGKVFAQHYNFIEYSPKKNIQADLFLHLASKRFGTYNDYIESNINYLQEAIQYCKDNQIKNFVFLSAVSVYGDIDQENITEETPVSCSELYGISKVFGEKTLEECGLNVLSLRVPMVLTKNKEIGVLNFFRKELNKNNLIKLSNGEKLFNNFIYFKDILDLITKYDFSKKYQLFLMATQQTHTLFEIVEFMKHTLNSSSQIIKDEKKVNFFNIDISKLETIDFKVTGVEKSIYGWLNELN